MTIGRFVDKIDIYKELTLLDRACEIENVRAELVLLGGSGMLVLLESIGETFRATIDIDVNILTTNDFKKFHELARMIGIDIVGGVVELPPSEDFKEEGNRFKIEELQLANIDVYVPSIELLACTKIFSTRPKDFIDLEQSSILENCNLDILLGLVEEYSLYLLNPNNPNSNHHRLTGILKEKGLQ